MAITRVFSTALLALSTAAILSAQTTFTPKYSAFSDLPRYTLQADLNGDGIPDIINGYSNPTQALLSTGGGNYTAHNYAFHGSYLPVVAGDFNGDGKNDVLFFNYVGGSQLFDIAYGDGHGNFPTIKPFPTVPGYTTGNQAQVSAVATDVNGDGRVDILVTFPVGNGGSIPAGVGVRLYLNNGSGFTDKGTIYSYTFPAGATGVEYDNTPPTQLLLGDYDADGHADLALRILYAPPNNPVAQDNNLFILYGSGTGTFTAKTVYTHRAMSDLTFSAADINDDGYTDLVGTDRDSTIHIFRGAAGRTFTESIFSSAFLQNTVYSGYPPVIADFDGNGYKDIAYAARPTDSSAQLGLRAVYQTPTHTWTFGAFTPVDTFQSYFGDNPFASILVGDYSKDAKPDAALLTTSDANTHPQSADFLINTGSHAVGSCLAPAIGINVCSPGTTSASPVNFAFSATSFYPLRKMEVWVDGAKKSETYHVFANQGYSNVSLPLAAGTHTVTFFAGTFDGDVTKKTISVKVP